MISWSRPEQWVITDHAAARYRDRFCAPSKTAAARELRALLRHPLRRCGRGPRPHFAVAGVVLVLDPIRRRITTCWPEGPSDA